MHDDVEIALNTRVGRALFNWIAVSDQSFALPFNDWEGAQQ